MKLTEVFAKKTYRSNWERDRNFHAFVFPEDDYTTEENFWRWLSTNHDDEIDLEEFTYGKIVLQISSPGSYRDVPTNFVQTVAKKSFAGRKKLYWIDDINEGYAAEVYTPLNEIIKYLKKHTETGPKRQPFQADRYT